MGTPLVEIPWRDGERRPGVYRAALLFLYLFLVLAGYVATKAARDALFIDRFGAAALPYADIASAVAVVLGMTLYLRAGRRLSLPWLQTGTLLAFAAAGVAFWWAGRRLDRPWLLPALYVWASGMGVLLPVQVWTMANHVFTTRQAKRLFGIVGSGAVSGWIAGGLLTRAVAQRSGADILLPITSAGLTLTVALVWALWREGRHAQPAAPDDAAAPTGLLSGFAFLRQSRYLSAIAALVGLSALVTTIAAWQFRAVAGAAIPDRDALAAFFGTFNFYAGMLSLAVQLLLTAPLLRRFGLGAALLLVPLAIAGGSAALALTGTLWAAVLLKGGDQVLRYAIDRPATELLYLPLPDGETFIAKSLIDTAVLRAGDLLGSGIVLGALALSATPARLGVLTLALAGGWAAATVGVRREYVRTLQASIRAHRMDIERLEDATIRDRSTADAVAAVDPLDGLEELGETYDVTLHVSLIAYLSRPGPQHNPTAARVLLDAAVGAATDRAARAELAEALTVLPDEALASMHEITVALARELLDPARAPEVRAQAPALLLRIGTPEAEHALVEHLTDPDPGVRLHVLRALNKSRQRRPEGPLDRELVDTALAAEVFGHYRSYQILGLAPHERIDLAGELERIFRLLKLLFPAHDLQSAYVGAHSRDRRVHDHALEFLEHTLPPRTRDLLIPLLDRDVSPARRRGLANWAMGAALDVPASAVNTVAAADAAVRAAAEAALSRFAADQDEANLTRPRS